MDDGEASGHVVGRTTRAWVAVLMLAMTFGIAVAQEPAPPGMSLATAASRRFPQPIRAGSLIGRTVLQPVPSRTVLGRVKQIVRAHDTQIQLVMAYGGWFGVGARTIAVPVDAMAILEDDLEILDFTPKQLGGFPPYDPSTGDPVGPGEVIHIGLARPSH